MSTERVVVEEAVADAVGQLQLRLVLGLLLRLDGSEGRSAEKVRAFAERLREALPDLPLEFADERLNS